MAKRRCISVDVMESDEYQELSNAAKCMYIALMLRSDDEGVVINPRTVMRMTGFTDTQLDELIDSGFVLKVDNIYVIKHWYLHNKIQPSRIVKSLYQESLSKLRVNKLKEYELIVY